MKPKPIKKHSPVPLEFNTFKRPFTFNAVVKLAFKIFVKSIAIDKQFDRKRTAAAARRAFREADKLLRTTAN
jgi:hypothetical protein